MTTSDWVYKLCSRDLRQKGEQLYMYPGGSDSHTCDTLQPPSSTLPPAKMLLTNATTNQLWPRIEVSYNQVNRVEQLRGKRTPSHNDPVKPRQCLLSYSEWNRLQGQFTVKVHLLTSYYYVESPPIQPCPPVTSKDCMVSHCKTPGKRQHL